MRRVEETPGAARTWRGYQALTSTRLRKTDVLATENGEMKMIEARAAQRGREAAAHLLDERFQAGALGARRHEISLRCRVKETSV